MFYINFEFSPILASCMQITLINTFDSAKVCIRILSSSNFEFNESMFRLRTVIIFFFFSKKVLKIINIVIQVVIWLEQYFHQHLDLVFW